MGTEDTYKQCDRCDGEGTVECEQCYGSGRHGTYPNQTDCVYCDHGRKKCPECGGSGRK